MKVEKLMSHQVFTCKSDDTLNRAAQLMWEHDCGAIPVVASDGKVIGMVTDRDIAMAAYTKGKGLRFIGVSEVMTRGVQVIGRDDSVVDAETAMKTHRVRRLPVVDKQGRAVGVVSLSDIARAARQQRRSRKPDVTSDEIAVTLAAISEPRRLTGPRPAV